MVKKLVTKDDIISFLDKEAANLSRILVFIIVLLVGCAFMAASAYFCFNTDASMPGINEFRSTIYFQIFIAMGASIIASTIFYLLYSLFAEKRVLRYVTKEATESAFKLFQDKFDKILPLAYFPGTKYPTVEFDTYFNDMLKNSKTYRHKGDSGSFITFRLATLYYPKHHSERDIEILLLDPKENSLLEEQARIELSEAEYSRSDIEEGIKKLRKDIFVSLISLFDHAGHRFAVTVKFHKELLFFRSEIFDHGIFISYYFGGDFPGTYLYSSSTFSYEAFLLNFRQHYNLSNKKIEFNGALSEGEFKNFLYNDLGCELSLEHLREAKEERFKQYNKIYSKKFRLGT